MDLFKAKNESDLCEKSGIGRSTLAGWKERGSLPKLETILDVSIKTGVSLDYLLLGKPPNTIENSELIPIISNPAYRPPDTHNIEDMLEAIEAGLKPLNSPDSVPREIADLLDLPGTATVQEAVEAMEERLRETGGFDTGILKDELAAVVRAETETLRDELAATVREELTDASALSRTPANDDEQGAARPVPVVEVASAAGAGAAADMETVTGHVWFRQSWLHDHDIDPKQCTIIGVEGDSMYPTLVDGCSILVDRNRTRRRTGHIYVIRTDDGLIAKRLGKDSTGNWILKSDNEAEPDRLWSDDMEIIGEVRWTARTLLGSEV